MADNEGYQREQQLLREIARLEAENVMLQAELETAVQNIAVAADNVDTMSRDVLDDVLALRTHTASVDESVDVVKRAIEDLSHRYFLFKNLSTASKNLTQCTEEYYTRFAYFHKLRRITLGYVIGLDNSIISNETLRKEVEKIYLQNTDYWLAYAIAAVMLWANDEKEAALRAVRKSIAMDVCKTDIFFLLINLRFERLDAAKDWYLDYLDKVDITALTSEYQYLLEAYLAGLFGADPEFEQYVSGNFRSSIEKINAVSVGFSAKFTARAREYAQTYLHRTEHELPTLAETCSDYELLIWLLGRAECNAIFAQHYAELAQRTEPYAQTQAQRVEDVLYNLINAYDDAEWKVIKRQKYNEAVIAAKGNLGEARAQYELQYANLNRKRGLDEMMVDWAFSDDPTITNLVIKRFAISLMREPIARGFAQFAQTYRDKEPGTVHITVDGYALECGENDFHKHEDALAGHYAKDKLKHAFQDTYVQIFGLVILASLVLLSITAFRFSPVTLTIGVLGAIVGGFVLWRRLVEVGKILEERKRLGLRKLQQALEELAIWRDLFHEADAHAAEVAEAFSLFE